MKHYQRNLKSRIQDWINQNYILIIYGARQVGKTTLVNKIIEDQENVLYLNCDELEVRDKLKEQSYQKIKNYIGSPKFLIIDEAQRIENIGLTLKILFDNEPDMQIITAGSSSFDLANKINEPLTGRSISFRLYPLSLREVSSNNKEAYSNIEKFLLYGSYPKIFNTPESQVKTVLKELAEQFLYKDLLSISGIQKSDVLIKLLKCLAYQIGQEVSYTELANNLGVDKNSVVKYIDILEKSFVVFRLSSYCKNLRSEIKKQKKIYFYDLGMRNALINDFNEITIRSDKGMLWENLCIVEKIKENEYKGINANYYFWRTHQQKEIDLVIEIEGKLEAFEFKSKKDKSKVPKKFLEAYPNSTFQIVTKENFFNEFYEL